MSFETVVLEAHEQGWYVYQLCFEPASGCWSCTLRALTGPPRREISHGHGADAIEAICNALAATPELEHEVSLLQSRTNFESKSDLSTLLRKKFGPEPLERRI